MSGQSENQSPIPLNRTVVNVFRPSQSEAVAALRRYLSLVIPDGRRPSRDRRAPVGAGFTTGETPNRPGSTIPDIRCREFRDDEGEEDAPLHPT